MKRTLPCDACGKEVKISATRKESAKERFLRMVREREKPLCGQCRRYVSPGSVRRRPPVGETEDIPLVLADKQGNGKLKRGLDSMPLKRCGSVRGDTNVVVKCEDRDSEMVGGSEGAR